MRLTPQDWASAKHALLLDRAANGDVDALREMSASLIEGGRAWAGWSGSGLPNMKLEAVNFNLPKIVVMNGPLKTGYTERGGYLFAQSIDLPDGLVHIDLHDQFSHTKNYDRSKRILAVVEPPEYTTERGAYKDHARLVDTYSEIWTFIPEMLDLPNARKVRLAEKWVDPRSPDDKVFGVSAVISHKTGPAGSNYKLRQDILAAEKRYTVPTRFWNPSGVWLGERFTGYTMQALPKGANPNWTHSAYYATKQPAFDYMFHVCIENTALAYYVTEKLMDCFATHTVPILVGDPELGDEFDEAGIIRLDRNNWLDQVNSLTYSDYVLRLPAVRNNYEKSKRYWSFQQSILSALRESGRVA